MKSLMHRPLGQSEERSVVGVGTGDKLEIFIYLLWRSGEIWTWSVERKLRLFNLKDARQAEPLVALLCRGNHVFSARARPVIFTDAIWTLCEAHFARQHHSAGVSFRQSRGKKFTFILFLRRTCILSTTVYAHKSCEWFCQSKIAFLVPPAHFGCVIVHDAQLLFLLMWKMHNYNNYAEGEKHCNHVITFPTVCLIEFKVPLGLWFLTAGR